MNRSRSPDLGLLKIIISGVMGGFAFSTRGLTAAPAWGDVIELSLSGCVTR
jgi:hypothetical protein